jgi:ubiquinone/menaquinone biosynthesis C-methylase UbiE
MMSDLNHSEVVLEEDRIKSAYQRTKPAGYYSFLDPGTLFLVQERERLLLKRLREHGRDSLAGAQVLEVGCGSGHWLREFIKWGASPSDITGAELRADMLSSVVQLCPSGVRLHCMNAIEPEFPDESFDMVLQSMVFTSVLNERIG